MYVTLVILSLDGLEFDREDGGLRSRGYIEYRDRVMRLTDIRHFVARC